MAASVTLVLTSVLYSCVAAYICIRLGGLWPSRTKAPYAILLASGIILQLVTYVLIVLNFAFLAFLPRRKQIPLLATVAACLFHLLPLLLIACTVRALHARLSALTAARPPAQEGRFKLARYGDWFQLLLITVAWVFLSIGSRNVSDALNGRLRHDPSPLLYQLGELVHALTFTSLTYMVLVFSRRMNGFLLLPDKVGPAPLRILAIKADLVVMELGSFGYKYTNSPFVPFQVDLHSHRRHSSSYGPKNSNPHTVARHFCRWVHMAHRVL
jgi:hypothetical protein